MSGSSLDGLDIAFVELQETAGKWKFELKNSACYEYTPEWKDKLSGACDLNAKRYNLLHTEYGHYTGELINRFISENNLQYQVQLISSHGHTTFHMPEARTTSQLGCGASIAAETGINVVCDLRAMDVALGGQGAPIVPIGEKLLLGDAMYFLNLGGIANISFNSGEKHIAFDVCPANRVLNMLAATQNKEFDDNGSLASAGKVDDDMLKMLNGLEYYSLPYPKSLSNDFGTEVVYPIVAQQNSKVEDALRTYVEHICQQVLLSVSSLQSEFNSSSMSSQQMLVTGGGARNSFVVRRLTELLSDRNVLVDVPENDLSDYKEAIIMALIGVLRWREENNVLASVTGASRNSIGGAVWIGQEA